MNALRSVVSISQFFFSMMVTTCANKETPSTEKGNSMNEQQIKMRQVQASAQSRIPGRPATADPSFFRAAVTLGDANPR
jgi:hypothetical protein